MITTVLPQKGWYYKRITTVSPQKGWYYKRITTVSPYVSVIFGKSVIFRVLQLVTPIELATY